MSTKIATDLEKLQNTVDALCNYIETLSETAQAEQAWGPKEVLAHLVQYHESFADQASAIVTGNRVEALKGRFIDVNAQAVDASRGIPVKDLIQRFKEADTRLRDIAKMYDPTAIYLLLKQDSVQRTLADVITMVEHHIRSHHRQLMRGKGHDSNAEKLRKSLAKFTNFVEQLSTAQQDMLDTALHNMLAVMVFIHKSYLNQADAILSGRSPQPPQGRVVDLEAQAIEAARNLSQNELLQQLESVAERLCELAELNDPDKITFEFRKGAGMRTLNEAIGRAETDLRRGLPKLRRLLR